MFREVTERRRWERRAQSEVRGRKLKNIMISVQILRLIFDGLTENSKINERFSWAVLSQAYSGFFDDDSLSEALRFVSFAVSFS